MTKTSCRMCSSTNSRFLFNAANVHGRHIQNSIKKFKYFQCDECDAIFLKNIKINNKYYNKYYRDGYYSEKNFSSIIIKIWLWLYLLFYKYRLQKISKLFSSKKKIKILDIGCGNGDFLSHLPDKKYVKFGLEINPEGVRMSKSKGIKIFDFPIEKATTIREKFDLITMWHVFEHLENPLQSLKILQSILKPKGYLILQVPNNDSLGFKIGKENWFHLDSPRHLVIPSSKSMKWALKKTGFKMEKTGYDFFDYPLDLYWSIRNSQIKYLIYLLYPFFKFFSHEHITCICKNEQN